MPSDFTPNAVWGSTAPSGQEEELTTPTGQTCRARKMTIDRMIETGILAHTDAITALVSKHVRKVKGGKGQADGQEINEAAMLADPDAMKSIIGLTDKILPHVVVSPRVQLHYTEQVVGKTVVTKTLNAEQRVIIQSEHPGTIFTDQIGLEDKMFLFEWAAGGLQSMTSFRGESLADVGGVVHGKGSKGKTKRSSGNR